MQGGRYQTRGVLRVDEGLLVAIDAKDEPFTLAMVLHTALPAKKTRSR